MEDIYNKHRENLKKTLSDFGNSDEILRLYQTSPLFNNIIHSLINSENTYSVILTLIKIIEDQFEQNKQKVLNSPLTQHEILIKSFDKNFKSFEKIFFDKLEFKTGWGRNEIKSIFLESYRENIVINEFDKELNSQLPDCNFKS